MLRYSHMQFYSTILINPASCSKILQSSRQGHSGFQDLILFLKPLRDVVVIIFTVIAFQTTAPKYLIEFLQFFNSVLTKGICKVY